MYDPLTFSHSRLDTKLAQLRLIETVLHDVSPAAGPFPAFAQARRTRGVDRLGNHLLALSLPTGRSGGIGRRAAFRAQWASRPCGFKSHLRHQLMQEPFVVRVSKSFPVDLVTIWSHRHEGEKGAPGPGYG